jgi:hypothetical protein
MKINKIGISGFARKVFLTALMNRSIQKALSPFGHDLQPDRWIFVIGCYNSATTLLASILRQHPDMEGLPNEGAFLTDVLPYPDSFGWPRMWSQCVEKVRIGVDENETERAERIKRHWSLWYSDGARNLVEKSISNAARLLFLQEYFQPAYFIYIVRNGYVVSKGIQQKTNYRRWNCSYQSTGYPIELCAEQWKMSDEIVAKDSLHLENFLQISYEELTAFPQKTFGTITDFLGLESMPEKVLGEKWSVHETTSSITDMNHIGLSRLASTDFAKIEKVAGDTLKKYGYARNLG